MAFDGHANFAYGTVATGPSPATSGTSLVLGSGQGALMPAVPFNATCWPPSVLPLASNAEIVRVTAVSTDTLTIVRAQESATAQSIVAGWQFAATVTRKLVTDLETAISGETSRATAAEATLTTAVSGAVTIGRNAFNANTGATIVSADRQLVNTSTLTAARTVTLPAASSRTAGTRMHLVDESNSATIANSLTWTAAGSDIIVNQANQNGTTSLIMQSAGAVYELVSNGSNQWTVLNVGTQRPLIFWGYANQLAVPDGIWTPMPWQTIYDTSGVSPGFQTHTTTVAAGSNAVTLPTGTINVASTSGFPTSGYVLITGSPGTGIDTVVGYTGVTGTSFTGCNTAGTTVPHTNISTGTLATGQVVTGANCRFMPQTPYLWAGIADICWSANDTGFRRTRWRDGTTPFYFPLAEMTVPAMNAATQHVQAACQPGGTPATNATYIEVYQSSGGVLNTAVDGIAAPLLMMVLAGSQ